MRAGRFRHFALSLLGAFLCFLILLPPVVAFLLHKPLTRYIESDAFRRGMEKETAKGLHLGDGNYEPIRRTGLFEAGSDGFEGSGGRKAIESIHARDIQLKFNPWGIFLRRWQIDDLRIGSGTVQVHTYELKSEPVSQKPWYAVFLPDRVYLKQVICDPADVVWFLRGRKSGFFNTRLLITPHGRDFEYHATGGVMRNPMIPETRLRKVHLLITHRLLTLYDLDLASGGKTEGTIRARGKAGLKDDKSVNAEAEFDRVSIEPWLPASWEGKAEGVAEGNLHWMGQNAKLETASGYGSLRIHDFRVRHWQLLEKVANVTGKDSLRSLRLDECSLEARWKYPRVEFNHIAIEERGKFRIAGSLSIERQKLAGTLRLGVSPDYLDWLPNAGQVFAVREGGYLWTTFHLAGTVSHPSQDLSPKIVAALEQDPGAMLEFLFRQAGNWLEGIFGGDGD